MSSTRSRRSTRAGTRYFILNAVRTTLRYSAILPSATWNSDFANAAKIIKRRLRWPRSGAQPLETVGAVAEYESGSGKFTIHVNSSMYNYVGWTMALSLGVAAHKVNFVPVIAGGSFGSKLFANKGGVLAAAVARICGRPVKYIEDRIDKYDCS